MKISYNWLKQFLKTKWTAEETEVLLTDLGLEVEGITNFESIKGGLEGIVVGHVESCEPHPNADRLKITKVNIGKEQLLSIVCGAPNVAAGQNVPVATIGTTLYDDKGQPWPIKKGKIRGEVSEGMICAEDEIGIGKSHEGIMVLGENLIPGTPLNQVFSVERDQVFEIGLTPNRADAMSHWGVARDLRAGLIQNEISIPLDTPSISSFHVDNRSLRVSISVKQPELAPRYCGVSISGLEVKDSPDWLKNRLKAIGINSKNNVVDATNYVLHELGQPLHAFDLDKVKNNKIEVKTLKTGTKFITLDGVERELHADDLMICDAEKPLCIAGVFGGEGSGVTTSTTDIFLESAYFNPVSIRKTAKRHGLNTDASFRFERGIDPNITEFALKRAVILIQEIAGGVVSSDIDDFYPKKIEDFQVFLTFDKINQLIGQEIDTGVIKTILTSLDIKVNNVSESGLGLTIPAYRVDVQREVDVIEEILRVYGYNNIESDSKFNVSVANSSIYEDYKIQNRIADQLVSQGFFEIMSNSLTTKAYVDLLEDLKQEHNVDILNALSNDLGVMRQSMLFSGLESVSYNINRKKTDLKFFEFGKTYHKVEGEFQEFKHLSLFMTGSKTPESWTNPQQKTNFFGLKAYLERIFEKLGLTNLEYQSENSDSISEGLSGQLNSKTLVDFGRVKSKILDYFDIEQEVLFADINWNNVLDAIQKKQLKVDEIPRFPSTQRDFALLLDQAVKFDDLKNLAFKTDKKILKNVDLFDVYEGDKLPEQKKSYALRFKFMDEKKTLTDKQVDKVMQKLQNQFETKFGATLR
ncbi:phenylalanine--tRNA ligase subunit beta [Psychroflexus montanilacus]|uniref:phenylalanine--tRNA ligase subunit beta n=1 Tax=Psychroflexus montanilacus TaxID=2873598 RepID=UPI001CCA88E3|nr:phenylalanine--tRNA ligase subunit beta [Psychroflexus montanilacus]MBZ9653023.1 phenylalanine--tRNA ligase subunit beta [Psychroflexus montanilacus]